MKNGTAFIKSPFFKSAVENPNTKIKFIVNQHYTGKEKAGSLLVKILKKNLAVTPKNVFMFSKNPEEAAGIC